MFRAARAARIALLVVLALGAARAASAAGIFHYAPPDRWLSLWQRDSDHVWANDSLGKRPATPWADFNDLAQFQYADGFLIVGNAGQESRLLPNQVWVHGHVYLYMLPRPLIEDEAAAESYCRVGFNLAEAHDATMHLVVYESDGAGGATGSSAAYLDAESWGGSDPTTVVDQPVHLAAGNHLLEADADVFGIMSIGPDPVHTGSAEYFFVLNLDGGTAGVEPGAAAGLHVLTNPVRGDAQIGWSLVRPGHARLRVFDVAGRQVTTLLDADEGAGPGLAHWSTAGVAPGLYLARLEGEGFAPIVERLVVAH